MGNALKYHILAWSVWKSSGDVSLSSITSPRLCLLSLFSENKDSKRLWKKQHYHMATICQMKNNSVTGKKGWIAGRGSKSIQKRKLFFNVLLRKSQGRGKYFYFQSLLPQPLYFVDYQCCQFFKKLELWLSLKKKVACQNFCWACKNAFLFCNMLCLGSVRHTVENT